MLARKSVAITGAPCSRGTPRTTAVEPFITMSAPIRISSSACMKRFSKIVSVMTEVPFACASSAIICACKSVGNPGYGSVRKLDRAQRATAAHAHAAIGGDDRDAGFAQLDDDGFELIDRDVPDRNVAAGDRRRDHQRARLDTIGNHFVFRAVQLRRRLRSR